MILISFDLLCDWVESSDRNEIPCSTSAIFKTSIPTLKITTNTPITEYYYWAVFWVVLGVSKTPKLFSSIPDFNHRH